MKQIMYCTKDTYHNSTEEFYILIYDDPYIVEMAGCDDLYKKYGILKIEVEEVEGDQITENSYWAWIDYEDGLGNPHEPVIEFVYDVEDAVRMCFPYKLELYIEKGQGKLVRVNIKELERVK